MNRQPRDHEIGGAPVRSEPAGDRKQGLHSVRRPSLQGHIVRRHLPAERLTAVPALPVTERA